MNSTSFNDLEWPLSQLARSRLFNVKLEVHSIERIYLRQRCFDASKPRVAAVTGAQYGFSRRNKIPRWSGTLWEEAIRFQQPGSGSKVDQFVHVPTPVDMQNVIEFHARVFITRQHTDARYWYSKSVRPSVHLSVRPLRSGIVWKRLNMLSSFFSLHGSPIILVLPASNIFTKFRRGHPLHGH